MNKIIVFLLSAMLLSCSATKPNPNSEKDQPIVRDDDPAKGFSQSKNKKFFIKWSPQELVPRKDNKVTYSILNSDKKPLETREADILFQCDMPSMPGMGGPFPATSSSWPTPGIVHASFYIDHGGVWRFFLIFSKDGREIDRFEYDVRVGH